MSQAAPADTVDVQYLTADEVTRLHTEGKRFVLGEIAFGEPCLPVPDDAWPRAVVAAPQLLAPARTEVWTSDAPARYGQIGGIKYAHNDRVLFGCLSWARSAPATFEEGVRDSYAEILSVLAAGDHRHLIRIWNYFPRIHAQQGPLDRYQQFCRGRFEGIARPGEEVEQRMPAATAIGTETGDLVIYFIAAREPGSHRDNPRQIAPYRYPPQYGPRSPSFARATSKPWGGDPVLYIAGTASIVGHESRHPESPAAQLDETLRNIRALLQEGQDADAPLRPADFLPLTEIKVYLRDAAHLSLVKSRLDALLPHVSPLYLQGEICRRELLMEIEAVARKPR